jgi:hypothetical protein
MRGAGSARRALHGWGPRERHVADAQGKVGACTRVPGRRRRGGRARALGVPRGCIRDGRRAAPACLAGGSRMEDGCTMCPWWIHEGWRAGASGARAGCSRHGRGVHPAGTMGARRRLGGRAHHGLTVHEDGQVRSPARGVRGRRRNRGCAKEPGRDRAPRDIGALGSDPRPERKAARERKRGHVGWRGSPSGPTRDASRAGERRRGARRNGGRSPVPPGIPHRPSNRGFLFSAKAASASRRSSLTSVRS